MISCDEQYKSVSNFFIQIRIITDIQVVSENQIRSVSNMFLNFGCVQVCTNEVPGPILLINRKSPCNMLKFNLHHRSVYIVRKLHT